MGLLLCLSKHPFYEAACAGNSQLSASPKRETKFDPLRRGHVGKGARVGRPRKAMQIYVVLRTVGFYRVAENL